MELTEDLDDIQLLNIYRYPEFYPEALYMRVRNSRVAQKRLEELLRGIPDHRIARNRQQAASFSSGVEETSSTGTETRLDNSDKSQTEEQSPVGQFLNSLKKIFS